MVTIDFCDRNLKFKNLWEAKKHVLRFGGNCFYTKQLTYVFDGKKWYIWQR